MRHTLPSIQIEKFDVNVLDKVIRIYELVTRETNINEVTFNPHEEIDSILVELTAHHQYLEFRFGSALSRHSKLFIYPLRKSDGLHAVFDFDPNTYDDARSDAVEMRGNFHLEVKKYFNTLTIS